MCLVVPNLSDEAYLLTIQWQIYNLFIFIGLWKSTWMISRCFHFEKQNWQTEYIIQLIFVFKIAWERKQLAEWIVFGSMLVSFSINSSLMYTTLTSVSMHDKPEVEFKSIQDVVSSNLEIRVQSQLFAYFYNSSEGSSQSILDRSTQQYISKIECLQLLVKSRNVSCLVIYKSFLVTRKKLIVESASSYVNQLNKLILLLKIWSCVEMERIRCIRRAED